MDHFLKYGNVLDSAQFDAYYRAAQAANSGERAGVAGAPQVGEQAAQPRPRAVSGNLQPLQDRRLDDTPSRRKRAESASERAASPAPSKPAASFEEQVGKEFDRWLAGGAPDSRRAEAASRMEYAELEQERTLKLDGLALGRIPAKLGQFQQLRQLRIGGNRLDHLPTAVTRLVQLKTLDARDNRMTELSERIGRLTELEHLHVDGNCLKALPNALALLTKLKTFSARVNELTLVPSRMCTLKELRTLDLADNRIWELPSTWGPLFRLLENVDLSNNQLQALPATCEPPARKLTLNVEDNPALTTLPTAYGGFAYRPLRLTAADDHKLKDVSGKLMVKTKGTSIRQGLVNQGRLNAGHGIEKERILPARYQPRAAPLHDNDSISTCSELSFVRDHAEPGEIEGMERVGTGVPVDETWGARRVEAWVEPLAEQLASRNLPEDASEPAPTAQPAQAPWDTVRTDLFSLPHDTAPEPALPPARLSMPQLPPGFLAALRADIARLPEPQASVVINYLSSVPQAQLVSALTQLQIGMGGGGSGAPMPISGATSATARAGDAAAAWFAAEPSFSRDRAV